MFIEPLYKRNITLKIFTQYSYLHLIWLFTRYIAFTKNRTGRRLKGLTLQTLATEEVAVRGTWVCRKVTGVVQSTQVQENRPLVITHKIRFPCGEEKGRD